MASKIKLNVCVPLLILWSSSTLCCAFVHYPRVAIPHSFSASTGVVHDRRSFLTPSIVDGSLLVLHAVADDETKVKILGTDEQAINKAANFMTDSFWLQPQMILQEGGNPGLVRADILDAQVEDLFKKYGERMGKRILKSCIIVASAGGKGATLLGMVCIDFALLDKNENNILNAEDSEGKVKEVMMAWGPKERKKYKNAPFTELVTDLLPGLEAVVILSNLAVSPDARRMGLGAKLCLAAEKVAKEDWDFNKMYLRVEASNAGARGLYENKLGYEQVFSDPTRAALRVDIEEKKLVEINSETFTLTKNLP